ncbi:PREDICTED: nuclear pore-associated protein 1-like [Propithecus coquereli]|uniref:nuclear pore-associated protein 1-like n=1 Tax=Propithecus coquereli TaxID=379532 RepID=UPI00063FBBB5|nr:PREDICTED: nuclear pore-associated protein 1-like [Propithecus coquereli]
MIRQSRSINVPPVRCKVTLLRSPPKQVVKAAKLTAPSHLLLPCQERNEVRAQENSGRPRRRRGRRTAHGDPRARRQEKGLPSYGKAPPALESQGDVTSWTCSPGPSLEGHLHPHHPENTWSEEAQVSPMISCPEGHAVTGSHSPAEGVLPPGTPDPGAAVLPDPAPGCSWLLEKLATRLLRGGHGPSSPGPLQAPMSGKEMQGKEPAHMAPRISSPRRATRNRPCKRKMSLPLLLLPLPLSLLRDRGELPPPPKFPCIAAEED